MYFSTGNKCFGGKQTGRQRDGGRKKGFLSRVVGEDPIGEVISRKGSKDLRESAF